MRVWILLVLVGCFPRYAPIRDAARAERKGADNAEAMWRAAMKDSLAISEYRLAHRRLCRIRGARIASVVAEAGKEPLETERVRTYLSQLAHCPGFDETQARLTGMQDARAEQALAGIEPDARFSHVYEAVEPIRLLSADHPERLTFEEWRSDWVTHLRSIRGGPAIQARVHTLESEATGREPPEHDLARVLEVDFEVLETSSDDSCGLETVRMESMSGGSGIIGAWTLTDCRSSEVQKQVDVPYALEKFRWEERVRTVTQYRTVTVPVRIATGTNCYQISDTRQSCHTQYRTSYQQRTEPYDAQVTERVRVPYYENAVRQETRFVRTDVATLVLTESSPIGTRESTRTLKREHLSTTSGTRPDYQELLDSKRDDLERNVLQSLKRTWARKRADEADLSTPEGVEERLLAVEAGHPLHPDERRTIAETLGIPEHAMSGTRTPLHDITPMPLEFDPASRHVVRMDDGVLQHGFPLRMGSIGFSGAQGLTNLPRHPAPRALLLTARLDVDLPLVLKTRMGRFGLHVAAHAQGHIGIRTQKGYRVDRATPDGDEPRGESWLGRGADGSLGVLAGYRTGVLGLFGGIRGRSFFSGSGFTNMGGASLPLTARLEVRPVPRRPIIVSAWSLALVEEDPLSVYGASVAFPIFRGGFLVSEFAHDPARVQVRGRHLADFVEGGIHPHRRLWVGFGGGF